MLKNGKNLTGIINHDLLVSLGTLKSGLKVIFDTELADNIIGSISSRRCTFIYHSLIQDIDLFGRDPSGISEQMCKILAVDVFSDRILLDRYSGKNIGIFHDQCNRLLGNIGCDGCTDILTV